MENTLKHTNWRPLKNEELQMISGGSLLILSPGIIPSDTRVDQKEDEMVITIGKGTAQESNIILDSESPEWHTLLLSWVERAPARGPLYGVLILAPF